jgi:hypothetical protein
VLYDILISSLTVTGIVGSILYSYKLARSRVYPIGIVRNIPQQLDENGAVAPTEPDFFLNKRQIPSRRVHVSRVKFYGGGPATVVTHYQVKALHRELHDAPLAAEASQENIFWSCEKCGFLQGTSKDKYQCRHCGNHSSPLSLRVATVRSGRPVNARLTEIGQSVDAHSQVLEDLEKRIRQLELDTIKKQVFSEERRRTKQNSIN